MLIDLSASELILIRQAIREYRTVAPEHIANDKGRLQRWREERELYADEITSVDLKMTAELANQFDQQHKVQP